jgi:hypothetical protein
VINGRFKMGTHANIPNLRDKKTLILNGDSGSKRVNMAHLWDVHGRFSPQNVRGKLRANELALVSLCLPPEL